MDESTEDHSGRILAAVVLAGLLALMLCGAFVASRYATLEECRAECEGHGYAVLPLSDECTCLSGRY